MYYDIVRDGVTWFREQNNIEWKTPIRVAADVYSVDSDGGGVPDVVEEKYGLLPWYPGDGQCGDVGFFQPDISGVFGLSDCYVNNYDLVKLASIWLSTGINGEVNLDDYAELGDKWLCCTDPENLNCWLR